MRRCLPLTPFFSGAVTLLGLLFSSSCLSREATLDIREGDHISIIGNTLAERMQYFGHFETLLHTRFPQHQLVIRNLGYSADEVSFRPRSLNWGSPDDHLSMAETDVILAFFGFNESFAGPEGLEAFKTELTEFIRHTRDRRYNGESAPRLALISPIAHEDLGNPNLPNGARNNQNLALYTRAMAEIAHEHEVPFVDLFEPARDRMKNRSQPLTINGVHLSETGYAEVAQILDQTLFGSHPNLEAVTAELRAEINEKNLFFFHRYRAVNGYYIYGGRSQRDHGNPPFTDAYVLENERGKLDDMAAVRDERVWKVAQGLPVSAEIDDSKTRSLYDVPTNFHEPVEILPPEQARKHFKLARGYAANLFASEVEFPELKNPVQLTFDARGRLWILTMPDYPMFQPPNRPNDRLLILEDSDHDGRADKLTVFADGLHVPTGFELGDGGVYISQQPSLMFLKDTDGDDKADVRKLILHGFDSADSHHSIGAFTWGPGGGLYMHEGTFHHTSVETHSGPVRNAHGGVYRYDPTTQNFETFVSYNFANPWGHVFDAWGQNFVADASGGRNYFGTAFSGKAPPFTGQPDFGPFKYTYRSQMKQFIVKRVRPTAGCEFVSSQHFPPSAQGNFLLNNVIGFQGILQHRVTEEGSGFVGTEIEPILFSSDRNFRPTDLQFGPDGALYVVDWFNPLVGHMQHNLRDPNRDTTHGRVWRITYPSRPLSEPAKIAGAPIEALLELLKSYEDRTRYRVRLELREHAREQVVAGLKTWIEGLDPKHKDYEHHRLEALWVYQHHNVVNTELLKQLLRSPDRRARAAATRVLAYWRDQIENPLDLLLVQGGDDHPRVRLEAVRAASFSESPRAAEVALEVVRHPIDDYLSYTLGETIETLKPHWHPILTSGQVFLPDNPKGVEYLLQRLRPDELQKAARNKPVYTALLSTAGVKEQYRLEGLSGLAGLNQSNEIAELLSAIRLVDRGDSSQAEPVLLDLGRLLERRSNSELNSSRSDLERLAKSGRRAPTRRLANVALIVADQGVDGSWKRSSRSLQGLQDLAESVRLVSNLRLRSEMHPKLEGLLRSFPPRLAGTTTKSRSRAEVVRTAAIEALPSIPSYQAESLHLLAELISSDRMRVAAIRALQELPREKISDQDLLPLVARIVDHLASLRPRHRTSEDALNAAELAGELADLLPADRSDGYRDRLADLAVTVISIKPLPNRMQYDRKEIFVEAGRPVEIVFENVDIMPHNLLITAPGALLEVGMAAERMAARPDAFELQFVPRTQKVLYATKLLQPRQLEKLQFTAPGKLGDYPYVCTFPGHWRTMVGTMHVVDDLERIDPDVLSAAEPAEIDSREFVKAWKLADLAGSLGRLDADRNFENGDDLFTDLSCSKCHQMNGSGGQTGPDLTLVSKKLASGELDRLTLLREVVEPSAVLGEKYRVQVITTKKGVILSGVVTYEDEHVVRLVSNPLESETPEEISKNSIKERWESTISVMPEGLLNTATSQDILDLVAYVATGGGLKPTLAGGTAKQR